MKILTNNNFLAKRYFNYFHDVSGTGPSKKWAPRSCPHETEFRKVGMTIRFKTIRCSSM